MAPRWCFKRKNLPGLPPPVADRPAGGSKVDFRGGQKGAIVELFGWKLEDVTKECDFLAQAGTSLILFIY